MVKAREEAEHSDHRLSRERKQTFGIGLLKGMGVTLKHLFKKNTVIQYPDEKQDLSPRTRGVIALKEENCTVCMLCARECPDWCIYIDSHKETLPPKREGGRPRKRNVLDRFAIDYALCMYCGICVEVCPYDALFWSREFEYAEYDIRELTHEKERLSDWMATVLPPPPLEEGAEIPGQPAAAVTPTVEASGARAATVTSSAAEARTEQAQVAPKAGTVTPTDARPTDTLPESEQRGETESVPEPAPAAMAPETRERGEPGVPDADSQIAPTDASAAADAEVKAGAAIEQTTPEAATEQRSSAGTASGSRSSEQASPSASTAPAEASPDAAPASSTETTAPAEDPQAVYERVLAEQQQKGSSPQVAEARAKVARVKAERGVRTQAGPVDPVVSPEPSAPTAGRPTEPEPSGAPEASEHTPDPGPVAPTSSEGARQGSAADPPPPPQATPPAVDAPVSESSPSANPEGQALTGAGASGTGDPQPAPPSEASASASGEDPEAAYNRVLAEEREKGSSEAVATARAKAARVRAQKGTQGPGGSS